MQQGLLHQLIAKLRRAGREFSTIDAKQELVLVEMGDKAEFVKDVAAMANDGEPSYIVIGLVDGTFEAVGRLAHHFDKNTLNQLLADKIDPPIAVDYWECSIDGAEFAVVSIDGKNPPYIVARDLIPNPTDRKRSRVSKGSILVRQEDRTTGISRSELDELLSRRKPQLRISFERDRSVQNDLKTRVSLLCYVTPDGPSMAKNVSVSMYFRGCQLFVCPDEDHGHMADHFGNQDQKSSLVFDLPRLYAETTSRPIRFTLALNRVKNRSILVVARGENIEQRSCLILLSEISDKPEWRTIASPVQYLMPT